MALHPLLPNVPFRLYVPAGDCAALESIAPDAAVVSKLTSVVPAPADTLPPPLSVACSAPTSHSLSFDVVTDALSDVEPLVPQDVVPDVAVADESGIGVV